MSARCRTRQNSAHGVLSLRRLGSQRNIGGRCGGVADPAAGPLVPQILLLGLIVTISALPCDALVAVASGSLAGALRRSNGYQKLLNRLSGGLLIGLGVTLALSRRSG